LRIAKWQTRDPIGYEGGINLYGYVLNRPFNFYDPLGLISVSGSEFAEPGETQHSSYGPYDSNGNGPIITPNVPAASLPGPVSPGTEVTITNPANGNSITVPVVDKGPWNTRDSYWKPTPCSKNGTRPLAESQFANQTTAQNGQVPSNPSGIDLTPAVVKALGLNLGSNGTAPVDWHFSK
jgi:uncharacterized protein RhaS with RHS repeats